MARKLHDRTVMPPTESESLSSLTAMTTGLAITVMPRHTMLTTQEAADLLGISRPTLVKLLSEGAIAFEQRGDTDACC